MRLDISHFLITCTIWIKYRYLPVILDVNGVTLQMSDFFPTKILNDGSVKMHELLGITLLSLYALLLQY